MFGLDPLPRNLEAALRDAADPKTWVRASAVRDLARHGEGAGKVRVTEALVERLLSDPSAEVRGASAVALADVRAEGATGSLVRAASDSALHVRQMALVALGEIGDPSDPAVARVLDAALSDDAPALRFQAIIAANQLHPESAEPALLSALDDLDREIRHVAFRLLEERGTRDEGSPSFTDTVVKAARRGLSDRDIGVRTVAAILLARAGDPAGRDVIAEACSYRGKGLDPEDEQAAIEVAGELRLESARSGLSRRAFGSLGFRRTGASHAARIALARMGDARAESSILRSLGAFSRDQRTLAVVAAGEARLAAAREPLLGLRGRPERAEPEAVEEALAAIDASLGGAQ